MELDIRELRSCELDADLKQILTDVSKQQALCNLLSDMLDGFLTQLPDSGTFSDDDSDDDEQLEVPSIKQVKQDDMDKEFIQCVQYFRNLVKKNQLTDDLANDIAFYYQEVFTYAYNRLGKLKGSENRVKCYYNLEMDFRLPDEWFKSVFHYAFPNITEKELLSYFPHVSSINELNETIGFMSTI